MIDSAKAPLITVGMPVYNAGEQLRPAVLSIVGQTCPDWELLIIDDGSTDGALRYIADIHDDRIRILSDGQNKGLAARLNECIDLARGAYFARMDQDDVSFPERFERQLEALQQDPQLDLLSVRALKIAGDDEATGLYPILATHEQICARPWVGFYFPHPTWMGKTSWFRRYRYTVPGPYYSEDMDLLLRSYATSRFGMLPAVLFAYRVRSDIVWAKQLKARKSVLAIQWKVFGRSRQWIYAGLAFCVMVLRLVFDGIRVVRQKAGISGQSPESVPVSVISDWNRVRAGLPGTGGGR